MMRKFSLLKGPKQNEASGSKRKPLWNANASLTMVGSKEGSKIQEMHVKEYLDANPDYLEEYVMSNVSVEVLARWVSRRTRKQGPGSKRRISVHGGKKSMLKELTSQLQDTTSKGEILYQLCSCISGAIGAEHFDVYIADDPDTNQLIKFDPYANPEHQDTQEIGRDSSIVAYAADTRESICCNSKDSRFPDGVPGLGNGYNVLVHPVVQSKDSLLQAVLQFAKPESEGMFQEKDAEIVESYSAWSEIALYYLDMFLTVGKQKDLSGFLLTVVKSIFMEMISMDSLIIKIMNFAQKLVDADRASLFLVDSKTNQLYARIFDIKCQDEENEAKDKDVSKEIRFPVGIGIAGYVAETGETLNVSDAYSDSRFNKNIDEQTGYLTKSILCMPICIRGQVIGVVQMVNKSSGIFTKDDEEAFGMFAIYCGLALHHAKLYDKIRRSEQKYKVALEVLSYHNGSSAYEVEEILKEGIPKEDDIEISSQL